MNPVLMLLMLSLPVSQLKQVVTFLLNLSYLHFLTVMDAVWKQMPGAHEIQVEISVLLWVK